MNSLKPLKAVLVGCGGISAAWLKPAKEIEGLEIVGLVDLVEENARKRSVEYNLPQAVIGTDLAKVLDKTNPDIVFDCTVPEAHAQTTVEALSRGCHVFGEKPMADSMANARHMLYTAQQTGKFYAVMQNRRYLTDIRRLRQFIDTGTIGALTTLNCDFYIGAHFGGFRDQMRHPLVLDMAIHTFDAARYITGADPVSVYCQEWNPAGSWYAHGASAVAIFEMTGGLIYTYRGSWCSEGLSTSWECDWRVIGQKGSVKWDGGEKFENQVVTKTGAFFSEFQNAEIPAYSAAEKMDGHPAALRDFIQAVRANSTPLTDCHDNIKSLAMVFGAIESAETGKPVKINF
jgi:predicted dehydrogenase